MVRSAGWLAAITLALLTVSAGAQPVPESVYPPLDPVPGAAGDDRVSDRVQLDLAGLYMTDHVWRGIERFDDRQEDDVVLQLAGKLSFDLGKLPHPYIDLFVNIGENDPVSSFQEVRPTFGFDWPVKPFVISAGHSNYIFPDRQDLDSAEVFFKLSLDDSELFHTDRPLLSPYILAAYDYDRFEGLYLEAGLRHAIRFDSIGLELAIEGHVAYVTGLDGLFAPPNGADAGFQHYQVGANVNYELNKLLNIPSSYGRWRLVGYVNFTDGIDNNLFATTQLWGGGGIAFEH